MDPYTSSLNFSSSPINENASRADLEKRRVEINTLLAALTPFGFKLPDDAAGPLQARLKKNELIVPDVEVLRQLMLEKARIAEKLGSMNGRPLGLQSAHDNVSSFKKKRSIR